MSVRMAPCLPGAMELSKSSCLVRCGIEFELFSVGIDDYRGICKPLIYINSSWKQNIKLDDLTLLNVWINYKQWDQISWCQLKIIMIF